MGGARACICVCTGTGYSRVPRRRGAAPLGGVVGRGATGSNRSARRRSISRSASNDKAWASSTLQRWRRMVMRSAKWSIRCTARQSSDGLRNRSGYSACTLASACQAVLATTALPRLVISDQICASSTFAGGTMRGTGVAGELGLLGIWGEARHVHGASHCPRSGGIARGQRRRAARTTHSAAASRHPAVLR